MTLPIEYKLENLGIIAGGGTLPSEVACIYTKYCSGKCFIAAISDVAVEKFLHNYNYQYFAIGAAGKILKYFKKNKVKNIVLVGNIKRPDIKSLKPDIYGAKLIAKILMQKILGDDHVLRIISDEIEKNGFNVVSPRDILFVDQKQSNVCTKNKPSKQDIIDIEIGISVLSSLGELDVGQAVIVCNGYVLGIEAAEGTDNLIERCAALRKEKKGGVLIKISKKHQDQRLDLPTIGITTINNLSKYHFNGIYIEKCNVLISTLEKTKAISEENSIFICNKI